MLARDAASLARRLLDIHGLMEWRFSFDRSRRRFGVCNWNAKTIGLSRPLTELNGEIHVRDTILHEIAHALAGRLAGHGPKWRQAALLAGANPRRCYDRSVTLPPLPLLLRCPTCGASREVARRFKRKRSCGRCSNRFDPRFLLRVEPNPAFLSA
ncbi:MAG: SprT-like domain-containing protein [Elusimicrobia bacterium]|nr:SprT-like domain-containing protein [Elusimicrobiota bacterium]